MLHSSRRNELPRSVIDSGYSNRSAAAPRTMPLRSKAERRLRLTKLIHRMDSVNATKGVREPVASTAAVMIASAGTLNHNTFRRWVVMQTYSQYTVKKPKRCELSSGLSRAPRPPIMRMPG